MGQGAQIFGNVCVRAVRGSSEMLLDVLHGFGVIVAGCMAWWRMAVERGPVTVRRHEDVNGRRRGGRFWQLAEDLQGT